MTSLHVRSVTRRSRPRKLRPRKIDREKNASLEVDGSAWILRCKREQS
jgi:hypothetical protein